MEKEQKQIIAKMISTSYKEPIEKVIYHYLGKAVAEIMLSVKVNDNPVRYGTDLSYSIMEELLKKEHVKNDLCKTINDLNAVDICAEILHQYGLSRDSEIMFMHDEMMTLYRSVAAEIKNKIMLELFRS